MPSERPFAMRTGLREGCTPNRKDAALAQLVEHLIRNEGVGGSNPSCGTIFSFNVNGLEVMPLD